MSQGDAQRRAARICAAALDEAIAQAGGDMREVDLGAVAMAAEAQMSAEEIAAFRALGSEPPNMEIVNKALIEAGAMPSTIDGFKVN